MASFKVRYLVVQPGPAGGLARYFWQPSTALRQAGWLSQRVPLNWEAFTDAAQLEASAIARAQELNAELDQVRDEKALTAARPAPSPAARTISELVTHYKEKGSWAALEASTKRGYQQCINIIEAWAGDAPVRVVGAAQVQKLRASLAGTPAYANSVLRVLRLLLEHGRRHGWLQINVALRPGLTSTDPSGLIWPRGAVDLFVAAADRLGRHSIGTAVLLNEWLGQREGDVLRMPRSVLRNGSLVLRQSKTGAGVALPVGSVTHLATRLAEDMARISRLAAERKVPVPIGIIVNEQTLEPYKADWFRHAFAQVRAEAAKAVPQGFEIDYLMPGRDMTKPGAFVVRMEELTFMQLRHTAVTRLAEAECEIPLISTITGHSHKTVEQIIERYMVRTSKMARIAFGKRMTAEGLEPAVAKAKVEGLTLLRNPGDGGEFEAGEVAAVDVLRSAVDG